MTGKKKKKLIIAKICSYEKPKKKYAKVVLEQIPWSLTITH